MITPKMMKLGLYIIFALALISAVLLYKSKRDKELELVKIEMQRQIDLERKHSEEMYSKTIWSLARQIDQRIAYQDSLKKMSIKLEETQEKYITTARKLAQKTQENERINSEIKRVAGFSFDEQREYFTKFLSGSLIR